jgi:hypothetical protein
MSLLVYLKEKGTMFSCSHSIDLQDETWNTSSVKILGGRFIMEQTFQAEARIDVL